MADRRVALEGPRVRLEPLTRAHCDALAVIGLDAALWSRTVIAVRTREDMAKYIDDALVAHAAGTAVPFVIVLKSTQSVVGTTRFHSIVPSHGRCEIGFTWIGLPWQRAGLNAEAKYLMLRHAFEVWQCQRVEFKADAENEPSCRALEAIGAVREGVLRHYMRSEERGPRDVAIFSIVAPDWPGVRLDLEARLARVVSK